MLRKGKGTGILCCCSWRLVMGKGTGNATRVHALRVLSLTAAQSNLCMQIKGKQGLAFAVVAGLAQRGCINTLQY